MSETPEGKPKSSNKIPILGAIVMGVPIIIIIAIGSMLSSADTQYASQVADEHKTIQLLTNQVIAQNNTINSITNFLVRQQIPLDIGLLSNDTKLNNTLHHK